MATVTVGFETRPVVKTFNLDPHTGVQDNVTPESLPGGLAGGWQVTGFATGSMFGTNGQIMYHVTNQTVGTPGNQATVGVYSYLDVATSFDVTVIFGRVTVSVD